MIRSIASFLISVPFVLAVYVLTPFVDKKRAIQIVGPTLTRVATWCLYFWAPSIRDASEFEVFRGKMKQNLRLWKWLYDIEVVKDEPGVLGLNITNCPFCETLFKLDLAGLSPYVCLGDWEKARQNAGKWVF